MRAKNDPGLILQSKPPARAERKTSREKMRRKRSSLTSQYFPKPTKTSFRFALSCFPSTSIRLFNGERKYDARKGTSGTDASSKIIARRNIVRNKEEQNSSYSLFMMNKTIPFMNVQRVASNYFLHSEASAQGSVQSLGPLVYTWIGSSNRNDIRSNCLLYTSSSTGDRKPCSSCWKILTQDGFTHFLDCPIFRMKLDMYSSNSDFARSQPPGKYHCKTTCVELVGRWAEEHALRHLCSNQCFQRAFAPSREWIILRKKLTKLRSIGHVLNDWTCRLVHEPETDNNEVSKTYSTSSHHGIGDELKIFEQGSIPRTIFLSLKTGEVWKLTMLDLVYVSRYVFKTFE
mmetsp:Transcript_6217/g.15382  ORF Transcript_6217/g.15382 Transcript_6217/m.15382 type:complete len:345 (+) Transcript_6217:165-1199(+)